MIGLLFKLLFLAGVLFAVFRIGQALALADPDVIRLESINRYDDVAVSGDAFFLVEYTLEYVVAPNESIAQGWLGRLIDVGGSGQLAAVQPFSGGDIPDQGYSRGTFGFYFQIEPTVTGTLRITLEGNPALSPTPVGIFSESITQQSASNLVIDLRAQATRLEDVWAVDLILPSSDGVNRYSLAGEEYFTSALPNLRNLAPDLFVLQSITPEVPDRSFDTTYTDARFAIWDGTFLATGFQDLATFLNVSVVVARFFLALLIALTVAVLMGRVNGIKETEYAITLQIWSGYLIMFAGFFLGMVTVQVLGVMLVIPIVIMAVQWNLNRTGA